MVEIDFEAGGEPPEREGGGALLPEGWYRFVVLNTKYKSAKSGSKILEITYSVIGGDHANRYVWDNLVRQGKGMEKAVKWANGQLHRLCRAVGFSQRLTNTETLHGREFMGNVKVKKSSGYPDKNQIDEYRAIGDGGQSSQPRDDRNQPRDDEDYGDIPF